MQTVNANPPIVITVRNKQEVTEEHKQYVRQKIEGLHLDYPRIIEAKAILDIKGRRQIAEIILFCADHIVIEAGTEDASLNAAIDLTISKIARRMRKYKTRLLKKHRPKSKPIQELNERVISSEAANTQLSNESEQEEDHGELTDHILHHENFRLRNLHADEAIMDLELSERPFLVYKDADSEELSIIYRRKDGDYGCLEPNKIKAQKSSD